MMAHGFFAPMESANPEALNGVVRILLLMGRVLSIEEKPPKRR